MVVVAAVVVVVVTSSEVSEEDVSARIGPNSVWDSEGALVSVVPIISELFTTTLISVSIVEFT